MFLEWSDVVLSYPVNEPQLSTLSLLRVIIHLMTLVLSLNFHQNVHQYFPVIHSCIYAPNYPYNTKIQG